MKMGILPTVKDLFSPLSIKPPLQGLRYRGFNGGHGPPQNISAVATVIFIIYHFGIS